MLYPEGGPGRHLKERLKGGDVLIGGMVSEYARPSLTKLYQMAGFDFLFIEYEHTFFGPSDLAASLGHIGAPGHADVQSAIRNAIGRLKAVGKPAGILTANEDEARRYIDWGFTFVAVGIDVLLLRNGADALVRTFR